MESASLKEKIFLPAVFLLAAVLLFVNLSARDYWSDEIFSLPKLSTPKVVLAQSSFDVHPPLFFLLEYYWIKLFGFSETATRSLPALLGLLGMITAYLIAKKILPPGNLKYFALLLAVSPFYIFYARMTRYYTLTGLLCLLVLLFFLELLKSPKLSRQWAFWLSALLLIYTDYVGFLYIFCLILYFIWYHRQSPKTWLKLLPGVIALFILYLPWITNLLHGAEAGTNPYPPERSAAPDFHLLRFIVYNAFQSLVRIVYTIYNFTLGENVYPWNPLILIGVLGGGMLFLPAVKRSNNISGFWTFALVLPFLLYIIAVIFYSKVFSAANFALLPSKMFFLQPLWLMFFFRNESKSYLSKIGIILLFAFSLLSQFNYHRGAQFLNPKYQAPWRQIAQEIQNGYVPGDLVVTDEEPLLHYLRKTSVNTYGLVNAETYISEQKPPLKVKLAIRHRGEESIYLEGIKLRDNLSKIYGEPEFKGYVKIDGLQRKFWSFILGKDLDYYLLIYTYSI